MIYLIDGYAIEATPTCYAFGKLYTAINKKTNEEEVKMGSMYFYSTLEKALAGARKHMRRETLRKFDGVLEDAVIELRKLESRFNAAIEGSVLQEDK